MTTFEQEQQKEDLWSKKCPKCGHSASEHCDVKPGEEEGIRFKGFRDPSTKRYCHHFVPSGVKDYDRHCLCEITDHDYRSVGNQARIRVSKQKVEVEGK